MSSPRPVPSPQEGEACARLVASIAEGDPLADHELTRRFGPALSRWLDSWTHGAPAADDLYQETFRLALEKIRRGELREPRALAGFLRSLARNLAVQYFREAARERRRSEPLAPDAPLPAPGHNPAGRLLAREQAQRARSVLAALPNVRDREILARFYLLEEDKAEICQALGLGPEHFKRVLFRARERFRARWGETAPAPSSLRERQPTAGRRG